MKPAPETDTVPELPDVGFRKIIGTMLNATVEIGTSPAGCPLICTVFAPFVPKFPPTTKLPES